MSTSNTVEATLRSKYEDQVSEGVEKTRALMERTFSAMEDAGAAASAGIKQAMDSTLSSIANWRQEMAKASDQTDNGFKKMAFAGAAWALGIVDVFIRASKAALDFTISLVKEASEAFEVKLAFEGVAAAAGLQADVISKKLKVATEGQVSGTTLMRNAMKVLGAELPITADQYAKLVENSFRLSKSQGKDGVDAMNALTDSLIKGTSRGLGPALGVHLQVKGAVEGLDGAMGELSGKMPDRTKLQAFYTDLLAKTSQRVEALGQKHLTLEDVLNQADRTYKGLLITYGVAILRSEVLQSLLEKTSQALLGVSLSGDKVNAIALATNQSLIGLLQTFAKLLDFIAFFGPLWEIIWSGVKAIFFAFLNVFAAGAAMIINSVGVIAAALSYLPGWLGRGFAQAQQVFADMRGEFVKLAEYAHSGFDNSFDGFGNGTIAIEGLSRSTKSLISDMEKLKEGVVNGANGVKLHAAEARQATADQTKLNEQLKQYAEMLNSLRESVLDAGGKAAFEFAKEVDQINSLDEIGPAKQGELRNALAIKYNAEAKKRFDDETARREQEQQSHLKAEADFEGQLYAVTASGEEKASMELMKNLQRIQEVAEYGSDEYFRLRVLAYDAYYLALDKLAEEREKKAEEAARKEAERQKKEITQAIQAATTIEQIVNMADQGKLSSDVRQNALDRIPLLIDNIQKKLDHLKSQKVISDEQITEVQKLEEALEKLNRINMTPFQKMLQTLKDNMQQVGQQITQAWGNFWKDMVSGQQDAGKKFIAALIDIVAQQLMVLALQQTAEAIVSAAGGDFSGAAKHAAAAAALGALSGVLSGFASSLSSSSSASASSGTGTPSSSGSASSTQQVQPINVGVYGGAQSAQPPHKFEMTLAVESNDSHIVKVLKSNYSGNGELRTLLKK